MWMELWEWAQMVKKLHMNFHQRTSTEELKLTIREASLAHTCQSACILKDSSTCDIVAQMRTRYEPKSMSFHSMQLI